MPKFPHPGAYPGPKDPRDWLHRVISKTNRDEIPTEAGIEDVPLIIHDQGDLPICTGEAGAYIQMINQYFETGKMVDLSAMFIYKMNRQVDGLPPDTEGSTVKATVKTLRLKGACWEILYPTNEKNYQKDLPGSRIMGRILRNAYRNRIVSYTKCENLDDILIALAEKRPVIFSMYLLGNFYKARRGWVPREVGGENVGGHAMVAVRYNLEEKWVKVTQSWGMSNLTDKGYMYIPFDWFKHNIREDFPALMEAYTVLDYIPEEVDRIPANLTVKNMPIEIEVNGQRVKDKNIPPIFINEFGSTFIPTGLIEIIMKEITKQEVKVLWDEDTRTIKIKI